MGDVYQATTGHISRIRKFAYLETRSDKPRDGAKLPFPFPPKSAASPPAPRREILVGDEGNSCGYRHFALHTAITGHHGWSIGSFMKKYGENKNIFNNVCIFEGVHILVRFFNLTYTVHSASVSASASFSSSLVSISLASIRLDSISLASILSSKSAPGCYFYTNN